MTDHIESLVPADLLPPVRTQADLHLLWRRLMGELGFAAPQIWVLLLRDGRLIRPIKLEQMPAHPTPDAAANIGRLVEMVQGLDAGALDCAFLFARPGGPTRTPSDLAWARLLAPHSPWPIHLANDHDLTVVAGDDVATGQDDPLGRTA